MSQVISDELLSPWHSSPLKFNGLGRYNIFNGKALSLVPLNNYNKVVYGVMKRKQYKPASWCGCKAIVMKFVIKNKMLKVASRYTLGSLVLTHTVNNVVLISKYLCSILLLKSIYI